MNQNYGNIWLFYYFHKYLIYESSTFLSNKKLKILDFFIEKYKNASYRNFPIFYSNFQFMYIGTILGNWKLNAKMDESFHFVYELSLSSTVEAKELSSVAVSQKCSRIAFVQ